MRFRARRAIVTAGVLALPFLAAGAWLAALHAGYGFTLLLEGALAALAFTGFVALLARWRLLGPVSAPIAWLLYLAALLVTLAEALAWYFQGGSFNVLFLQTYGWTTC